MRATRPLIKISNERPIMRRNEILEGKLREPKPMPAEEAYLGNCRFTM